MIEKQSDDSKNDIEIIENNQELLPNGKTEVKTFNFVMPLYYFSLEFELNPISITILSSYSNEGDETEFDDLSSVLLKPDKILHNNLLAFKSQLNQNTSEVFHTFQYQHTSDTQLYNWNFYCLTISGLVKCKALVFISKYKFISAFRDILKSLSKNKYPIDTITEPIKTIFKTMIITPYQIIYFNCPGQTSIENSYSFLPLSKLNYRFLFSLFNLDNIQTLFDQFICKTPFAIVSSDIEKDDLIYNQLLNCFFPFNESSNMFIYTICFQSMSASFHSLKELNVTNANVDVQPNEKKSKVNKAFFKDFISNNNTDLIVITIINNEQAKIHYYKNKRVEKTTDIRKPFVKKINSKTQNQFYIFLKAKYPEEQILHDEINKKIQEYQENQNDSLIISIRNNIFGFFTKILNILFPNIRYEFKGDHFECTIDLLKRDNDENEEITKVIKVLEKSFRCHPAFKLLSKKIDLSKDYDLKPFIFLHDIMRLYKLNPKMIYINSELLRDKLIQNSKNEKYNSILKEECPIMIEFESYLKLINNKELLPLNKIECVKGVTAFVLSLCILYDLSNTNKNQKDINEQFDILFDLFKQSMGFKQRFNIVLSLMFEIIVLDEELKQRYYIDYINYLVEFNAVTASIFLRVNYPNQITNRALEVKGRPNRISIKSQELMQTVEDHLHMLNTNINESYKCENCSCPVILITEQLDDYNRVDKIENPIEIMTIVIEQFLLRQTYFIDDFIQFDNSFKKLYRLVSYFAKTELGCGLF